MGTTKLIEDSLQYIEGHLEDLNAVAEIAEAMGYSEFYFSRCFQHEMHMSVMEYVKKRRLIRASDAILNGEKIIDAAFRFGWQTHSGFTKSFKQEFRFCPALLKAIVMELETIGGSAMSHVFYAKTDIHATKEQLLEALKKEITSAGIQADFDELDKIYAEACEVYGGMKRYSGDEYVTHPLNVAILLAQMNADVHTIYAGIFWDSLKKSDAGLEEMKTKLPAETIEILEKLAAGSAEEDDEAVLVKLADRLHNMRTLDFLDEAQRAFRAKETLDMIMPLAKRIENAKLMDELNDLSMKYLVTK